MRNYVWKSSMAPLISQYLEIKHLSGLKYERQERCLQHFDHYFYYNGYEGKALTKEIIFPFIYDQNEADSTIRNKENLFVDFAKYISDRGHYAYMIVPQYEFHRSHYIPHIYTRDEITRFLHAVDTYPSKYYPDRNKVDPVLFRVLIGTGCRLSEALGLKIADHDRETGTIRVLHSKNDRSRIIPVSNSLNKRLYEYIDTFHIHSDADTIMFPGEKGRLDKSTAYRRFRDYLFMADIPHTASGPRIHDFRHTLAVENLRRWSEQGQDLTNLLPYLSAYMGHADFRATQYYLRLTSEIYPKLVEQMEDACWNIIPEGGYTGEEE